MHVRILAFPLLFLSLILFLSTSPSGLSQFRGGGPGGSPVFGMLKSDPAGLFEKMAKGRDHFLVSETFSLRERLTQFAKDQNITGDKITREQFMQFAERTNATLAPTTGTTPGAASSTPGTSDAASEMNQRMEFEFRRRDINGDGVLSANEMSDTLRQSLPMWDKNNDGNISMEEYKGYFQARYQDRTDQSKPSSGANVIEISEEDLDRRPVVLRAGKLPKELEAMFRELDTDQDGQINMAEWRKAGRSLDDFKEIDRNDDGLIIPEEVLRFQSRPQTASGKEGKSSESGGFGKGGFGGFGKGKGGFKRPGS